MVLQHQYPPRQWAHDACSITRASDIRYFFFIECIYVPTNWPVPDIWRFINVSNLIIISVKAVANAAPIRFLYNETIGSESL